ncbi:MAG: calcium-binding protein [Alphaproteobacteria bacterium]|nr:calcium-binding protein [Alphaproteobacteria bacterium]
MTIRIVIFRDEQQMVFEGARARRVRLQTGDKVLFEGTDLQKADFRIEGRDLMVEVEGEGQFVLEGFYDREQGRTVAELVLDEETLGQILGALQPTSGEPAPAEEPVNEHHFRVGFTDIRRYEAAGIDGVGQEGAGALGGQAAAGAPLAGTGPVSILTDVPSIYGGDGAPGPITGGTNAPVGVDDVVGPIDENATITRGTRATGLLGNDTDADPTQQGFLTVSEIQAAGAGATPVTLAGSGATTLEGAYGTLTIRANGNDTMIGGAGRDTFVGGDGNDYASYITSSNNVSINFVTGLFTNDAQNDLFHFTTEVLQLTNQSDLITLSSARAWEVRAEGGNDTISSEQAGGMINVLLGGAGDDQIRINAATGQFGVFAGELGNDTLQLGTGVDLDLTQGLNQSRMVGIETIDLAFSGNHQLTLGATHLANNLTSGTLRVLGDSGDRVELDFGLTGWTSVNNGSTTTYTSRDNGRSIEIENTIVTQIV